MVPILGSLDPSNRSLRSGVGAWGDSLGVDVLRESPRDFGNSGDARAAAEAPHKAEIAGWGLRGWAGFWGVLTVACVAGAVLLCL